MKLAGSTVIAQINHNDFTLIGKGCKDSNISQHDEKDMEMYTA